MYFHLHVFFIIKLINLWKRILFPVLKKKNIQALEDVTKL